MIAEFPLSRRHFLAGLTASPLLAPSGNAASPSAGRIMVQGRPQDTSSRYKVENIVPALALLGGVHKMRCREPYSRTAGWNTCVGLARMGVRFCFTLSARDIAKSVTDFRAFLRLAPGSIWAIEFPNEPDLHPISYRSMADTRLGFRKGRAPALMTFIRDFKLAVRGDPVLGTIPLIASNDFMQSEQAPFTSYGSTHIYPAAGTDVGARLDGFRRKLTEGRHRQGVITEWGRTTGGQDGNDTAAPVSLQMQASLLSSDIAAALQRPYIKAISIYELFCWSGASEISNFGLFNADLSPRPAVAAIRSVLA
jgi:hypothetical protein